jgi:hypothetical protein
MKLTEEQKNRINESIMEKILQWVTDREYWKARKMFENDPKLQKKMKEVFDSMEKASKMLDDYCKKYGCVEPSKHTKQLKSFKEMRAEKAAQSKKKR